MCTKAIAVKSINPLVEAITDVPDRWAPAEECPERVARPSLPPTPVNLSTFCRGRQGVGLLLLCVSMMRGNRGQFQNSVLEGAPHTSL